MVDKNDIPDGRSKRLGGMKNCERCKKYFEAFRPWGKFCSDKCGAQARIERFWKKKLAVK